MAFMTYPSSFIWLISDGLWFVSNGLINMVYKAMALWFILVEFI